MAIVTWSSPRYCILDRHDICIALQVLKGRAEAHLEAAVDSVVITIPSHFSMQQRLATMNAATLAGLERVSLLQVCRPLCYSADADS